jgi:hypothetical protein
MVDGGLGPPEPLGSCSFRFSLVARKPKSVAWPWPGTFPQRLDPIGWIKSSSFLMKLFFSRAGLLSPRPVDTVGFPP